MPLVMQILFQLSNFLFCRSFHLFFVKIKPKLNSKKIKLKSHHNLLPTTTSFRLFLPNSPTQELHNLSADFKVPLQSPLPSTRVQSQVLFFILIIYYSFKNKSKNKQSQYKIYLRIHKSICATKSHKPQYDKRGSSDFTD